MRDSLIRVVYLRCGGTCANQAIPFSPAVPFSPQISIGRPPAGSHATIEMKPNQTSLG